MLISILIVVYVFVGLVLIYILLGEIDKQYQAFAKIHRKPSQVRIPSRHLAPLRSRLILLAGNQRTAERLFLHIQKDNPWQSEQWCLEKAIYQLERDRI